MREILFRGKPINNGKWVFGCYYKQLEFYGDACNDHIIITSHEDLSFDQELDYFDVRPETIGQFTGLTDKNGKKVFEGDIIKWDAKEWGAEYCEPVVWDYSFLGVRQNDWKEFCEVIGNIHDNPDLLEGGAEDGRD